MKKLYLLLIPMTILILTLFVKIPTTNAIVPNLPTEVIPVNYKYSTTPKWTDTDNTNSTVNLGATNIKLDYIQIVGTNIFQTWNTFSLYSNDTLITSINTDSKNFRFDLNDSQKATITKNLFSRVYEDTRHALEVRTNTTVKSNSLFTIAINFKTEIPTLASFGVITYNATPEELNPLTGGYYYDFASTLNGIRYANANSLPSNAEPINSVIGDFSNKIFGVDNVLFDTQFRYQNVATVGDSGLFKFGIKQLYLFSEEQLPYFNESQNNDGYVDFMPTLEYTQPKNWYDFMAYIQNAVVWLLTDFPPLALIYTAVSNIINLIINSFSSIFDLLGISIDWTDGTLTSVYGGVLGVIILLAVGLLLFRLILLLTKIIG